MSERDLAGPVTSVPEAGSVISPRDDLAEEPSEEEGIGLTDVYASGGQTTDVAPIANGGAISSGGAPPAVCPPQTQDEDGDGVCAADCPWACHPQDSCEVIGGEALCDTSKRIFLTSTTHRGDMGGLAGADAICADAAESAGLPGSYLALLSDGTGSPSTRLRSDALGPYLLADGVIQVARNWSELMAGPLVHPVNQDENGASIDADPVVDSSNDPWGNTALDGEFASSLNLAQGTGHCSNWSTRTSSHDESGLVGDISTSSPAWYGRRYWRCHVPHRLICVQQ